MYSLSLLLLAITGPAVEVAAQATYDYIVVGSGPGGGPLAANLARAGFKTLLLEAGDDQAENPNNSNMFNFNLATNDERSRWDFWTKHSDDPARELKYEKMTWRKTDGSFYVGLNPPAGATQLGIWYPRAGTLGGCAMHNAGVTALPADADWEIVTNLTGDASWSGQNMRKYFTRIEKNLFLPAGTAGHGYNGWLSTSVADSSWVDSPSDLTTITKELAKATGQDPSKLRELVSRDINAADPNRDQTVGFFDLVSHADKTGKRSSPNDYIRDTLRDAAKYPLTVQLNSLVTKVIFDEKAETPTAIGVEVMQGASLYSADPRYTKGKKGTLTKILANKEVIISGGAFNTPQILKLSGIGPKAELEKFNITVVKDLPGVGENLADNYEAGLLSIANHTITGGAGPVALLMKTPTAKVNRNIYAWCGAFSFEGFWPGFPTNYGPAQYMCALCHMNPKSQAGSVTLRSADPQDTPEVNFRFFEHRGDEDLTEMLDAIKIMRKAFDAAGAPITPWNEKHPCPGVNKQCSDEEQKEFIKLQAYSHHPTSSCAIGAADDKKAVLDSKFRVHGVKNLRVVDASVFPVVPGAFPVLPTYMISEKASEDIINAAKGL